MNNKTPIDLIIMIIIVFSTIIILFMFGIFYVRLKNPVKPTQAKAIIVAEPIKKVINSDSLIDVITDTKHQLDISNIRLNKAKKYFNECCSVTCFMADSINILNIKLKECQKQ